MSSTLARCTADTPDASKSNFQAVLLVAASSANVRAKIWLELLWAPEFSAADQDYYSVPIPPLSAAQLADVTSKGLVIDPSLTSTDDQRYPKIMLSTPWWQCWPRVGPAAVERVGRDGTQWLGWGLRIIYWICTSPYIPSMLQTQS